MAQQAKVSETPLPAQGAPAAKSRVKAEYRYPVYDLADSVTVAKTIRERGGGAATADALASYLNYGGTNNGAFLNRVGSARMFGLIERQGDSYIPSDRAMRIIAPERPGIDDVAAMADAFRAVPLYGVLITRYRGQPLPPETGLRNAMETQYGVPKARTQIAYRVFMDSAATAGYFNARGGARTHLVQPQIGAATPHPTEQIPGETEHDPRQESEAPPLRPMAALTSIIERLQEALVEKIRDVPADDLEKVREYIKEIKALEAEKPAT
ncbi:MAG: hypothetical protein IH609_16810 [Dehalococcoidia bacterium]|nr:hypothetical protein [Dehalococcoidia bacterium]